MGGMETICIRLWDHNNNNEYCHIVQEIYKLQGLIIYVILVQ